jgi:hypothetical protein
MVLLLVVGAVLLAVGIVYLTVTAPHLPSFIPGRAVHAHHARHYNKRGILAIVLAAIAFIGAYFVSRVPSRTQS